MGNTHPITVELGSAIAPMHPHSGDIKVSSLLTRLFHSRVAQIAACTLALSGIAVVVGLGNPPLALMIAAIGIVILAVSATASRKRLFYEISLLYSVMRNQRNPKSWPWWDEISEHLALGALPLKNRGHHEELKGYAIVSLIEDFEFSSLGLASEPVTPSDWKKLGVSHLHIPAVDFQPVSAEGIKKGVEWIEAQIKEGRKVYIHCKAGRSRSTTVLIAYLAKKENRSPEEVLARIKKIRPCVSVGPAKIKRIKTFLSGG